ncbi:MAG: hypothetical protein ACPG5Z_16325 [Pseudoalteromonas sp.]
MKKSIVAIAAAGAICAQMQTTAINSSTNCFDPKIRNLGAGREPWKASGKRKMRVIK